MDCLFSNEIKERKYANSIGFDRSLGGIDSCVNGVCYEVEKGKH